MPATEPLTRSAIVVGAGVAGLTAAHRLVQAGVSVTVVDARDRPGGRVFALPRDGGGHLEGGGEFIMGHTPRLLALAAEVGLGLVPAHVPDDAARHVRVSAGVRHVEAELFGDDPVAREQWRAAAVRLGEAAAEVDVAEPWATPNARELDSGTLRAWLDTHVPDPEVRRVMEQRFHYLGGTAEELSLLFCLWYVRSSGDVDEFLADPTRLLEGGPSSLVARLADRLPEGALRLSEPVRGVTQTADGVRVRTDRGEILGDAVIMAMAPSMCARIAFEPRLPPLRDRLQHRWLQGRGVKFYALYDEPWWRAEGLSGEAFGLQPISAVADVSPPDDSEGRLLAFHIGTSQNLAAYGDVLETPEARRETFLGALEAYFGPRARDVREVVVSSWFGDPWSDGCGTATPPGILSAAGAALRRPVGRVHWAGEETGTVSHLEGAVQSGERAASELLGA